jgi:hypothetical protein
MDALEFMRELKRMCNSYVAKGICLIDCPLYKTEFCTMGHSARMENTMVQTINIIEKWSKENPIEIDWLKVPRNTPVLVRDTIDGEWQAEYFCAYFPHSSENCCQFITFDVDEQYASDVNYWRYCKLASAVDPTPYLKEGK